jgi:hypothetical protein
MADSDEGMYELIISHIALQGCENWLDQRIKPTKKQKQTPPWIIVHSRSTC